MYVPRSSAKNTSAPRLKLCACPCKRRAHVATGARSASSATTTRTSMSLGSGLAVTMEPSRAIRRTPASCRTDTTKRRSPSRRCWRWPSETALITCDSIERRYLAQRHQNFDRPRPARCSFDQAMPFEGDDHAVNRRCCHLEIALKVSFRWRTPVQFAVGHDERQVLTLQPRELEFRQFVCPVMSGHISRLTPELSCMRINEMRRRSRRFRRSHVSSNAR